MKLIDADALKRKFKAEKGGLWALFFVDSMPTVDAVPVVMCKDCKHFKKPLSPDMWGWCKKVSMDNKATVEDWYCADGERKEQNDERLN